MVSITIENVVVDFPVYGLQRSLRKALFGKMLGGIHQEESHKHIVVRALKDISISLKDGDRLGLMGHNGAGKTTMLRLVAGIYAPTQGQITIRGRVSTLFNTAPGLDVEDTGYENIYTCGRFLGMSKAEIDAKLPDIEWFAELGDYLALPVRTYSTGMAMRLGFAVATAIDPEILILDEGLSAGDARFAERSKLRIESLIQRTSILVLASHSGSMIKDMCNSALLLDHGCVVADGSPDHIIAEYLDIVNRPQTPVLTVTEEIQPLT